jgi:predicted DNA-binding transcriptional regulator YafY
MAAMRRADRLLQLIQILRRNRRPVTGDRMAAELEVSLRTIYRDISSLMVQGVPIRGEAGMGYVMGEGFDLPPLMFTAEELEALMLGLRWVSSFGDDKLQRAARDSVAKIGTVLPQGLKPYLYDSSLLVPSPFAGDASAIDESHLRTAIREERKLFLRYIDLVETETSRTIWPIALAYYDRKRLLIGWCELREAFRSFRTDRISESHALPDRYPKRRRFLMADWRKEMKREMREDYLVDPLT